MCRISGIISKSASIEQLTNNVKQMSACLANGGPDDEGIYKDTAHGFVYGHRRLSIIDLSAAGHQPMCAEDNQLILTFNGEIYNYPALKVLLTAEGYQFKTHSDTEVILAGYKHWGTAAFEKFEGMFAFALFDGFQNTSYLVRDQSGIKPMYYAVVNDSLIFASEVKAFEQTDYAFTANEDWKTLFLAFGHIPEPYTTLKEVNILPKANYLAWNHAQSTFTIQPFYVVDDKESIFDEEKSIQLIREKLTQAVKDHLIADAPIGVFLSGGIDSSILTLIANELVGENLNTLSINFSEETFSEQKYQDLITSQTKGKHNSYLINEDTFFNHFDEAMAAMDQPTQDGINSWFVNKCAKDNGLKAVLSGIGADEIFGGYPSFKRMKLIKYLSYLPNFVLRSASILPSLKIKRLYYLSYNSPIGNYLFLRGLYTPDTIAKILNVDRAKVDQVLNTIKVDPAMGSLKPESQASWMETNLYMQNQLLKDTDFMSMNHGIEVRVPFLDQNLLKSVHQIANNIKYKHDQPKWLLINGFKDILPKAIWDRPKMGFTFPFGKWLHNNKKITGLSQYEENKFATSLIKEFEKGKLHWSMALALHLVFNGK